MTGAPCAVCGDALAVVVLEDRLGTEQAVCARCWDRLRPAGMHVVGFAQPYGGRHA